MTADWQVYPTTHWNYAIDAQPENIKAVSVERTSDSVSPFTKKGSPIKLEIKARRVPAWLSQDNVADPVPQSPVKSAEAEETISLIPYAAAKLRITAFPVLGAESACNGDKGREERA
jgi:uncharacterized protein